METAEKRVVETYIREDSKLIHIVVNGEEIITTETHPFYVNNKGFVEAGELKVGDELVDVNNNILLIEDYSVEITEEPTTVYNFQVEDFHTYHVGSFGILVHNANCKLIKNEDGSYDVELSYKKGWTSEQKAQADAKCQALSNADTVKTNVAGKRNGTKTSRYRKDNSIPSSQDVDHIIDLQLGGADDILNMKGLDKSVNRSLGKQINILINALPERTVLRNFTMK